MPSSRFWGYYEFLVKYYETSNQTIEDAKREKVESVDWDDEVKELKRKQSIKR